MEDPIRVLLIEDSRTDAVMVTAVLDHAPDATFDIECADTLTAGLECLSGGGYDVVLLDLHLPDSAGLDTLSAAFRCAGETPIVVLTGSGDEGTGIRAVESGAQDYVLKGRVDARVLSRTVIYAIERQRVLAGLRQRLEGAGDAPGRIEATADAMRDFVSVVAHEIRSPLSVISVYADMLKARWDTMTPEKRADGLDAISLQVRYITRLTEDLLATEQIESGALRPRPEPVVLAAAISDSLELAGPGEPSAVDCPPGLTAWADSGHVRQMLVNYATNARRYGAPPFEISASAGDTCVEVKTTDAGEGVPEDLVPALFGRFVRDPRPERARRSTGLGLSIVRGLAAANGGDAWYERTADGRSCFALRLPQG